MGGFLLQFFEGVIPLMVGSLGLYTNQGDHMQIETLERAAITAGDHALRLRRDGKLTTHEKDDTPGADWATQADDECEVKAETILGQEESSEIVVGEEKAGTVGPLPNNGNCTVVDPIDGTTKYYSGQVYPTLAGREFGTTLCTLRDGKPVVGVMYFPVDRLLLSAEHGHGVYYQRVAYNGTTFGKEFLSKLGTWERARNKTMLGTDLGPWYVREVADGLAQAGFPLCSAMVAIYGTRSVLLKETAAYYNFNVAKVWDAAAGVLMVEEQGGFACDPWGKPLRFTRIECDWIIAANRELAEIVLKYSRQWPGRARK